MGSRGRTVVPDEAGARRERTQRPAGGASAADATTELLVEAGAVLAGSLEPAITMRRVAELIIPRLADLCVIDLRAASGAIEGVAVVASDPEVERGLLDLRERYPLDPGGPHPVARVLRSGRPELIELMTTAMLESFARSDAHARFMIDHRYRSAVVAPLVGRGRTIGALSLLRLGERAEFVSSDLELCSELARRAALAIDNARLFSELRMLEQRLEAILAVVAEAITVVDEHGFTVFANAAAAELLLAGDPAALLGHAPGEIMKRFLVLDEHGGELTLSQMPARRLLAGERDPGPLLVRNIVAETGEERWLVVRASAVVDPASGRLTHIVNVFENVTELKRNELGERLLGDASRVLASESTSVALAEIARMLTEHVADWCAIDLVDQHGELERVTGRAARSQAGRGDGQLRPPPAAPAGIVADGTLVWTSADGDTPDERVAGLRAAGAQAAIVSAIRSGAERAGALTLALTHPKRRFSHADVALAQELSARIGTALANARRFREHARVAQVLQQALLPQSLPQSDELEALAVYEAAGAPGEVGGDFYDVLECEPGHWLVLIGDVCGKGAAAAGVTALARHTLRAAAIVGQRPAQMLQTLHEALLRDAGRRQPCTVCIVLVRPLVSRAQLTVALAGHPPPLIVGAGNPPRPIGRTGTLLGAVSPIAVHETDAELAVGETLLLYTDGVTDAGRPRRALGEDGLFRLCGAHATGPLGALLEGIRREALDRAGAALRDDVALLGLRLRGAPEVADRWLAQ